MPRLRRATRLLLAIPLLLLAMPDARAWAPSIVNAVDSDTATLEGSIGQWAPWYSAAVSQSTDQAAGGTHSLKIDITDAFGWGVQLANWPGYPITPGPKTVGFSALSTATDLAITMTVHWRDAGSGVLQTDQITRTGLTASFQPVVAELTAPTGTTTVDIQLSDASGGPGDVIYIDDVAVMTTNGALDTDTSTLEGSIGSWAPWFNTAVSQSTDQAVGGTHSLRVDITDPFGWGVQLDNSPGFPTTPGAKSIGFFALSPGVDAPNLGVTMTVGWRDAAANLLQTDSLTIPSLEDYFQSATTDVTAPEGTAFVDVTFTHASGTSGDVVYIDEITVIGPPA